MKKYKYAELMVEITRKCNLRCEHCLRGDAQNVTMSREIIDRIFEDAADCKEVLFTGGEPLLALDEIEYFVDKIIKSDWTTSNIAMTINGTIRDKRLIDIADRFCQSKEERTFNIIISDDEFHDKDASNRAVKFYQNFKVKNGVIIIPQIFTIIGKQQEFTLTGRAIEFYKNHPQLDGKWTVRKEEQTNHRICIMGDMIPCAMYLTVYGGFESYVGENFETVDRLSYGSILQSSMSELIDNHNDSCVVSCHDAFLINYYNNLNNSNDLFSELVSQVTVGIINRFITAREQARKLYPLVSAYDIITAIPMPDLIPNKINQEILSESEHLPYDKIEQYIGAELIDSLPVFDDDNDNLQQAYEELLQVLALLKKPNTIISPNRVYGSGNLEETPEFKELAALNQKYANGELTANNSINLQCEAVYGKSFRDFEVEKIQNSDLPDEIKMMSLRKEELVEKLNNEITAKWKEFFTNFIKDFQDFMPIAIKNPNSTIFNFQATIQDTINDLKTIQKDRTLSAAIQKLHSVQTNGTPNEYPIKKGADGIRCSYCGKMIQTPEGRNIHCTQVERGLQCQYCQTINTFENAAVM